jgi:hypothetical protein
MPALIGLAGLGGTPPYRLRLETMKASRGQLLIACYHSRVLSSIPICQTGRLKTLIEEVAHIFLIEPLVR